MLSHNRTAAENAAQWLRPKIGAAPEIAVLTGTGLGDIIAALTKVTMIDYGEIPSCPVATVESHHGRLVVGTLAGRRLAVLQGRFHLYEGYAPREVTFPVRVMQSLGVQTMILTNAAGGLNPAFDEGGLMVIADHINLTGDNPLRGPNDDRWGPRFPNMHAAYTPRLRAAARDQARRLGIALGSGVYAGLCGPSLETPAEVRFLRTIGADAVGFSTVMEAIAAVHAGMQVLGLSVITNVVDPDVPAPASLEAIIAVAQKSAPRLAQLVAGIVAVI